ncbi:MAG: hypothetical protein E7498_04060 [Ruminococcus sp.]|nr:hypothetical protein [Ruminococcus sp.]
MKKTVLLSLLTAAVIPFTLCSCKLRDFSELTGEKSETETEASTEEEKSSSGAELLSGEKAPDTEEIRSHVEQLLDDIELPDNEKNVKKDIDTIVYDIDACREAMTLMTIRYYSEWKNKVISQKYDALYEEYYVATYLANYALAHGYASDEYSELFAPYITDDETVESLTAPDMSVKRLMGYARVDYDVMDEQIDKYYEIIESEKLDDDEKNLECAELYLDILSSYDAESFYEMYNRDYTPDEILKLSKTVRNEIIPAEKALVDAATDNSDIRDMIKNPETFDEPFEVILQYAARLSPEIEDAAYELITEELYTIADDDCYTGSFTDSLPVSDTAYIYVYTSDDYNSLETPVHEFGHYYALRFDDTPVVSSVVNIDIAEVQSQGFEFVFSRFFDEIYGDAAEAMHAIKTIDMLEALISGFLVGEFEYTVLKNRDTFTPEDVVECFEELIGDFSPDMQLHYIPHIFEQPGYYISYGVSALAAFDIWKDCLDDPDKAFEKYDNIAHVPCNSIDSTFCSALEESGFSDVLDKKYIENLADEITDYADELG